MNPSLAFLIVTVMLVGAFGASLFRAGAAHPDADTRIQAIVLVCVIPLIIGVLYAVLGEPRALNATAVTPHSQDAALDSAIERLKTRLEGSPDDAEGWVTLARSYNALGRAAEASAAYEHASAAAMKDPALLAEWIETRLLAADAGQRFDAHTQELIAHAIRLAPDHPDVLLMRSLAAMERGDARDATAALKALRKHYDAGSPDAEAIDTALDKLARGEDPRSGKPLRPAAG